MNKQELITDLTSKTFVDAIITDPILQAETTGTKWYRISFREIVGKVMTNRSIDFYVIDEGTETERAFYKDQEPTQQIKEVI